MQHSSKYTLQVWKCNSVPHLLSTNHIPGTVSLHSGCITWVQGRLRHGPYARSIYHLAGAMDTSVATVRLCGGSWDRAVPGSFGARGRLCLDQSQRVDEWRPRVVRHTSRKKRCLKWFWKVSKRFPDKRGWGKCSQQRGLHDHTHEGVKSKRYHKNVRIAEHKVRGRGWLETKTRKQRKATIHRVVSIYENVWLKSKIIKIM